MTPTWNESNCPPAISSLEPAIRILALDYANAELEAGRHPDRAVSFGIAKAFASDEADLGTDASAIYIQGEESQWVIFSDASDDRYTFDSYEDALRRGGEIAYERGLPMYVFSSEGAILEKRELASDHGSDVELHLQPGTDGWVVRGPDGGAPYPSKKAGLQAARDRARELHADLIVHYRDGSVQERKSYAN